MSTVRMTNNGHGSSARWLESFPPRLASAHEARQKATAAVQKVDLDADTVSAVEIVVGELVANAVRHAKTPFIVAVTVEDGVVRIEVFDRDARTPALVRVAALSSRGRGLHIVSGFSSEWGWHTTRNHAGVSGKVVWAELRPSIARGRGIDHRGPQRLSVGGRAALPGTSS
jgi:anti-sigma regulatory factor (Ser/Thr protein kinase)